ncbi:asparaginase [Pelagibacterales bacterium SAG-MED31]|nr:asparaginase [Pelagibacterales bacterium SAG-MED31]
MSKITTSFYRGNLVESYHNIKCYIGSVDGKEIFSTKNENDYIYPRSSIKIFQAIPFANSNAFHKFNLNKKQIALSCSSHCGENFHIRELKKWISKTKIKLSNLKCGIHKPLDSKSEEKLFLSGNKPDELFNNCAGKHLAMLTACKLNKFSINDYLEFDHPHQVNIRSIFSKFTEAKVLTKNFSVDGCSAPQYSFKIIQLGKALSNLYKSYYLKFEYSLNIKIMIDSILKNPLFIGGTKNLDSNLMKISNGKIFCKGGAEGVFLFLHIKKGIFGILKVSDGNERALPSAIYSLCKKFNLLNKNEIHEFKIYNKFMLYNHANIKVGNIETIIE